MKHLFLFTFVLLFVFKSFSQTGTFFIGDKTYTSSKDYYLYKDVSSFESLNLFFVKDGLKGMIVFKDVEKIKGTILVYLEDNSIIKLLDKNIHDRINGYYYSVYYLTETEINKLKNVNVSRIRYNRIFDNGFEKETEGMSYQNSGSSFYTGQDFYKTPKVDFPKVLQDLYN